VRLTLGKRWFAWIYGIVDRRQRPYTARIREELLGDLTGDVLDVGIGPGTNLEHYGPGARVTAVDYNERMLDLARGALRGAQASVTLQQADAGALPFADESFDAYVTTLVLCSVPDLERTIAEAWRVLRPGGALRLFEHVRSDALWKARLQSLLTPVWGVFVDGCHLDRDPATAVRARGFVVTSESHPRLKTEPMPLLVLHAIKPHADG
jgi:SAM-dependent methyltransferase